jgi:hypothetical protein
MTPPDIPQTDLADKLANLELPAPGECLDALAELPPTVALALLVAGAVYLLAGWRLHKLLVIVNATAVGAAAGAMLGDLTGGEGGGVVMFAAAAGGLMLGVLALPLMKGAVCLTGVAAGAAVGYMGWAYVTGMIGKPELADNAWAGALVGLTSLGLLAYANFRLAVMIFTAVQGAVMAVAGVVSLLMLNDYTNESVRWAADHNLHMLAAAFVAPAVIGLALQHAAASKKIKKKLKSRAPAAA